MAGKFSSVLWLYCILFAIPVCYPAEDSGILPESDVIKADVEERSAPVDINNTMLEEAIQTMNKTTIADVNDGTISEENSSQIENASEVVNTTNSTSASSELPKYFCKGRNNSLGNGSVEQRVIIVKADELMQWINTTEDNETDSCAVVLFYTEYCPFCANLAPLYNALGRVYNNLPVLAVDAYKQHSLNTRFGIVAVPTILLFHTGKPVLKFNSSVSLDDMRNFIKNNTGVEGNFTLQISEEDYLGPLKNKPVDETDYYLLLSVLFLLTFGVFMFGKSSYRQLLLDRIQAINWQRFFHWFSREKQE
ncbi:cell redox homeostasis [Porites harrisoni]